MLRVGRREGTVVQDDEPRSLSMRAHARARIHTHLPRSSPAGSRASFWVHSRFWKPAEPRQAGIVGRAQQLDGVEPQRGQEMRREQESGRALRILRAGGGNAKWDRPAGLGHV